MKRTSRTRLTGEQVFEASKMTNPEIRALVYNYHDAQDKRKGSDMQLRHIGDKTDPAEKSIENPSYLLQHYAEEQVRLERDIAKCLGEYAEGHPVGRWMMAQHGIGPVIAAGYLALIDIEQCRAAANIWSFSGLNPKQVWLKGEKIEQIIADVRKEHDGDNESLLAEICTRLNKKPENVLRMAKKFSKSGNAVNDWEAISKALKMRPFSADMKQLSFHTRECFKRSSNHPDSIYGKLYQAKKIQLIARNERGGFAEKAAVYKGISDKDNKKLLAEGKVPPAYIDKCAGRFAVKIFLSHLHAVWYWHHFGKAPRNPFAISMLDHAHEIRVPNTEMFPGFEKAYYGSELKHAA